MSHLRAALPGAPRAHYDLGVELFNGGRLDEAIEQFETLIRIWESPPVSRAYMQAPVRGDIVAARLLLGRAFAQQRRWHEAAAEFEQVLEMTPSPSRGPPVARHGAVLGRVVRPGGGPLRDVLRSPGRTTSTR